MFRFLWFFPLVFGIGLKMSPIAHPPRPEEGPGGKVYVHDSVRMMDFAAEPDGYWLFEPFEPRPDSAPVVVFNHGYGALNTMIYGQWIRHLVRRGNIVIFPRFQKNLFSPGPGEFAANAATGIRNALIELDTGDHVRPVTESLAMVGHSYGGTVSACLGVKYKEYGIPQPKAIMLCSPGTGPLDGGRLESYEAIPADTRLLVVVSEDDHVVGDELGKLVFETAKNTPHRNFIRQYADRHGEPDITAGHNQAYALYEPFDNGIHNLSYLRALRSASFDAMDYNGYWKLFDALLACTRNGQWCDYAFGNTEAQRTLGAWGDGIPTRELEVTVPK
jgi:pimeloyl-ACP methyl ester carboxylesterase